MFKNILVRELAITLAVKLFLVWVLWFSFFSHPAEEVDASDLFTHSSEYRPNNQRVFR